MTAANSAETWSQSGDSVMIALSTQLTERDAAVAVFVEQLKCGFVKCIRLAQKPFECLKLWERDRSIFVCVSNSSEKIHRFLISKSNCHESITCANITRVSPHWSFRQGRVQGIRERSLRSSWPSRLWLRQLHICWRFLEAFQSMRAWDRTDPKSRRSKRLISFPEDSEKLYNVELIIKSRINYHLEEKTCRPLHTQINTETESIRSRSQRLGKYVTVISLKNIFPCVPSLFWLK